MNQEPQRVTTYEDKIEVLMVRYSVFCTIVDAHVEGEYNDNDFVFMDKILTLSRKLAESIPQVEEEMRRSKQ